MLLDISSVPRMKMMPEAKAQMRMRYMLPIVMTSVTTYSKNEQLGGEKRDIREVNIFDVILNIFECDFQRSN